MLEQIDATTLRPAGGLATGQIRPALSLEELLAMLKTAGLLNAQQAADAAARAMTLRSRVLKTKVGAVRSQAALRYDVTPAEMIASIGIPHPERAHRKVDEDVLAELMAKAAGLPYLKIDPLRLDNDLISKSLARPFARRNVVVPVGREGAKLKLAIAEPFDSTLRDTLEQFFRQPVTYVVASKADILAVIERVYGFRTSVSRAKEDLGDSVVPQGNIVQIFQLKSNDEMAIGENEKHIVAAVDYLFNYAFSQRASDVHLEPRGAEGVIRYRIDGILHDIETVPISVHAAIASRIKVMARMDIAERRRPQDGRIKTLYQDNEIELRISCMPTAFGEKVVVRIFDPNVLLAGLQEIGFSFRERELYEKWITSPNGLILVTGPTGSGKTTTLYSTLRYVFGPEINITTIEDPIEMVDPRYSQVQVNRQIDLTFANALRTILRQDPDVIMVGEIRDKETAQMAVQAALTGHLVFSTLHTRDTAGAVMRMVELGVEPFLLSSVLRGVMAQRLIRMVCPHCSVDGYLTPDQVAALGLKIPVERREQLRAKWGDGCVDCRHTGLLGRTGIFEMLDVGRRVRELINSNAEATEVSKAARIEGMESLRESAIRKLAKGITTFEEVIRVTADLE